MAMIGDDQTRFEARQLKARLTAEMYGAPAATMAGSEAETEQSYLAAIPPESNIVGFGYGLKWTSGSVSAERAVRVYVVSKFSRRSVPARHLVPDEIDGIPTDVIPVGHIRPAFPRPTPCGVSGAHRDVPFGTLGCLVQRNGTGRFVLSNNHVLANVNDSTINPRPPILEPGSFSGGASHPPIARLTGFHPLAFGGAVNEIDAAIAELVVPGDMTEDIVGIGRLSPATQLPAANMAVVKHGATTQFRTGIVDDLAADVTVGFPPHGKAFFHAQFTVKNSGSVFADLGDSGSIVVEPQTRRAVGLLFAVADGVTYCNYIDEVLGKLGLTIL